MATIKDTAATSALNEDQYINKLYDANLQNQKDTLSENFENDSGNLDHHQQQTQQQTGDYLHRTEVESQRAADLYGNGGLSAASQAQVALSQGNAAQRNSRILREAQEEADAEYERQRRLMASEYETAIRQAQADNDMERAQALYEAAKAEEAQLLQLRKEGAALLKQKRNDKSGYDAIANGETIQRDTTGDTWEEVLKNEQALNAIYDAQLESQRQQLLNQYQADQSALEAKRKQQSQETDDKLTQAYVESLRGAKNSAEYRSAQGRGSGTAGQARLAQDIDLQDTLTDLRRLQTGKDADYGIQDFQLGKGYGEGVRKAQYETDLERAKALFGAAEAEEQTLIENQKFVGDQQAKDGDYTMLGLLYGLTEDQIRKLKYNPGGDGKKKSSGGTGQGGGDTGGGADGPSTPSIPGYIDWPSYWASR